ncbi:hypothetical protein SAMN05444149_103741 [Pseudosulfitobacter pseudonitzschiae]|uniref:hypothetical protein n=1 Tax=Pseudosulfitobacter pseudonitzschiae TaxID=1402135 RepID=UPI000919C40C|nr:hypothetical protein [Pseudosulfitobacter pseudonitzschiae]QKS08150.1 hypothetical protein HT745_06425 [Pseudosulfitobacter pseudonitzschiae]SHF36866.1 hypothetical protein SAMN05444149_103741 [Pseudosulfitobacter pseudonitzschiae]
MTKSSRKVLVEGYSAKPVRRSGEQSVRDAASDKVLRTTNINKKLPKTGSAVVTQIHSRRSK